jgi:hypothetical protein
MITQIYQTSFDLTGPVSDIRDAQNFLDSVDTLGEFNSDVDIPTELKDAVLGIEFELNSCDHGIIRLEAIRELTSAELEKLHSFVYWLIRMDIGPDFCQEDFAYYFDEYFYQDSHDSWQGYYEEGLDEWETLDDEEKESWDQEDYAREYATDNWGCEPESSDEEFYSSISFDCGNKYKFTKVS